MLRSYFHGANQGFSIEALKNIAHLTPVVRIIMAPVIRLNSTQSGKLLSLVDLTPGNPSSDILCRQPDQLLHTLQRFHCNFSGAGLSFKFTPPPLRYRDLMLPANVSAITPQQPRLLMFFQFPEQHAATMMLQTQQD